MDNDLRSLIAFNLIDDIGAQTIRKLLDHFINPSEIFKSGLSGLMEVNGIGRHRAEHIVSFTQWDKVDKIIEKIYKFNMKIITYRDDTYPELLKQIHDPPVLLFIKGELVSSDKMAIAVVGTRGVTTYGKDVTQRLSTGLAEMGITIVSGMARGVDTIAHLSALDAGGRTIAVLGCGLDIIYPYENKGLYNRIIEQGAVISEFLPGTPPYKHNFPARNRIVSGLSLGVLVTEAPEQSGALITAQFAVEQNREVFAVPGNIMSNKAEGNHKLIKEGAKFVSSVEDILIEIGVTVKDFVQNIPKKQINLDNEETILCNILSSEPIHIDDIIRAAKLNSAKVSSVLLTLEIKGIVKQITGMRFYLV
ncbi:MAG: DNA-protecting protein DprA [Nitrospirae bacterium]|nr:DNA-protecting protein DprA [Nitrospirota bacterium]